MPDNVDGIIKGEGAAGVRFKDICGGFYKDEKILEFIFNPAREFITSRSKDSVISVADLGCGSGLVGNYFEKKLTEMGYSPRITFIDFNQKMLDAIEPGPNRDIVLADISKQTLDLKVDIAVGRHFIHYLPPDRQKTILSNIYKIIKLGGLFINSTGSDESEAVTGFMSDYLSGIFSIRERGQSVRRYYQDVNTYLGWMTQIGFRDARVAGSYAQPHRTMDYFERYGFKDAGWNDPVEVEKAVDEMLKKMHPSTEIVKKLDIHQLEGYHHSVNMNARIFVANR